MKASKIRISLCALRVYVRDFSNRVSFLTDIIKIFFCEKSVLIIYLGFKFGQLRVINCDV